MLATSMKALVDCNRALTAMDFRAELRRIELPALLIHGGQDASAPIALTARKAANLLPQVRLETYEGAPHGLMLTHVQQLNADLLKFTRT